MSKAWSWIAGIVIALCIIGLMAYGHAERSAYWKARTVLLYHAEVTPRPIDHLMYRSVGR